MPSNEFPSQPWIWERSGDAGRARRELEERGISWFRMADPLSGHDRSALGQALFGDPLYFGRTEVHDIQPAPGGYVSAKTSRFTPLHVDGTESLTPAVGIMICEHAARTGGESTFLDTWALLDLLEEHDPALHRALFDQPRVHRDAMGVRIRPTFNLRWGHLFCFHKMNLGPDDEIGRRWQRWVDAQEPLRFTARTGDTFIFNNHRMLHGRLAFTDPDRRFTRILGWPRHPLPHPAKLAAHALRAADQTAASLETAPSWARQAIAPPAANAEAMRRLWLVAEHLAGADPIALAQRHGVAVADLLRWTDRSVLAATAAVVDAEIMAPDADDRMIEIWRARPALPHSAVERTEPCISPT